jgi:hypothetical protein
MSGYSHTKKTLDKAFVSHEQSWPVGESIDLMKMHLTITLILMHLRTLESALGTESTGTTRGTAPDGPRASAQTRTSEESPRSSSDGPDAAGSTVAGTAKESAPGGPARGENTGQSSQGDNEGASPSTLSSGTRPRRSSDVKQGVRPIKR